MVQPARIVALSKDLDGEGWGHGTHTMWNVPEDRIILVNDWFDFRPIVP